MSALAHLRDLDLLLGKAKPDFSVVACTVVCACKSRWLRNKRRSYRLWSTAASQVSPTLKTYLSFLDDELKDPPTRALALVNQSIQKDKSNSWKIKKNTGEEVLVRDVLLRIVRWIDRFKEVGTSIVQYDPVHAALPWAAICLCLNVALSNIKTYTAYVDGLEQVANIIAEYAEYQKDLLGGRSKLKRQLEAAIVSLYLAILNYLAEARRYLESSTGGRLARNIAHTSTPKAVELLDAVESHRAYAARLVTAVQHDNEYKKLTNIERSIRGIETALLRPTISVAEKKAILLRRLTPAFTNDIFDLTLGKCQRDTATWILDREIFHQWRGLSASTSKLLWIHGPPGTGKTIISAKIIQHLQTDASRFVTFFFCANDDEAKRDPNALIRSCVAQLVEQIDLAAHLAYQLFDSNIQRPLTISDVWSCFAKICSQVPNCTVVIDGFDECSNAGATSKSFEDDAKLRFLRRLIDELSKTNALVLLISRDDADIRTEILERNPENVVISQYKIQKEDQEQDIGTITRKLINEKLGDRPQSIREEIAKDAAEKSDGMILWVQLLSKEFRPRANSKALRRIVSEMPAGIEQAYERDLARLSQLGSDDKSQATHILRWMLFSSRPMTVGEIVEALIMRNVGDENEYPAEELPDAWNEKSIGDDFANDLFRRMFGSMIDLRSSSEDQPLIDYTVHFVHYSVKEYLLKPRRTVVSPIDIIFSSAAEENTKLAALCLRYLCFDVFDKSSNSKVDDVQTNTIQTNNIQALRTKQYPFSSYAAENWFWHAAHQDPISSELVPLIENLLDPSTLNWFTWSNIFEPTIQVTTSVYDPENNQGQRTVGYVTDDDRRWFQWPLKRIADEPENKPEQAQFEHIISMTSQPLYYASIIGIIDVAKNFWSRGYRIEDYIGRLGSPLHAAVYQGHKQLVAYLVEQGAEVQHKAGPFGYALIAAAAAAATADVEDILQFLLDHGANPDCSNDFGNTATHYAARNANVKILQKLIESGADLNVANSDGATALHCAAGSGNVDAVRTLLNAGVSVDAVVPRGLWYGTALNIAVGNGFEEMVSLLLSRGTDVHKVGYYGSGCLHLAADSTNMPTVDLMLTTDIDIDKADNCGLTALHYAAFSDAPDLINKLISKGADIKYRSLDNLTPLLCAVFAGTDVSVQALIEKGADVNIPCNDGTSALLFALCNGKNKMARLLIDKGADVNSVYMGFDISLLTIVAKNEEMIEVLIKRGINVNRAEYKGVCALTFACYMAEDLGLVKLLLKQGASSNSSLGPSQDDCTQALFIAVKTAQESVKLELIGILLEYNADPLVVHQECASSALDYVIAKKDEASLGLVMQHQAILLRFLPALRANAADAVYIIQTFLKHNFDDFKTALSSLHVSSRQALLNQLLIVAIVFNFDNAIEYLLEEGASVGYKTDEGRGALHYAAMMRDEPAIRKAVEHGALVNELDKNSCRAVEYATQFGLPATPVVEFLLRKEIELNSNIDKSCSSTLIQFWRDKAHCMYGEYINHDGETNQFSPFDIVPWPSPSGDDLLNEAPRFTGIREIESAPLKVYGLLQGEDEVMWLQMNSGHGTIFRGKVNIAEGKIEGNWGWTSLKDQGAFTMVIESKEVKEQRLVTETKKKADQRKEKTKGTTDGK